MRAPDIANMWADWQRELVAPCELCQGVGFVETDEDRTKRCVCTREADRRAALAYGNVPREFWFTERGEFDGPSAEFIERARGWHLRRARQGGRGLVMIGGCGVGKTTAACLILSRAARRGYNVGYITGPDLIGLEFDETADREWCDELLGADFLVLDEVGKEHRKAGSHFALSVYDRLLRRRRGMYQSTVIVTNMRWVDFMEVYGESILSIVSDRSTTLHFRGEDRRVARGWRG